MKKCWVALVLVFILMSLTGCNNVAEKQEANNVDIKYVNQKYGFSLVFS